MFLFRIWVICLYSALYSVGKVKVFCDWDTGFFLVCNNNNLSLSFVRAAARFRILGLFVFGFFTRKKGKDTDVKEEEE